MPHCIRASSSGCVRTPRTNHDRPGSNLTRDRILIETKDHTLKRNRSTGIRNSPFHAPLFRPFTLTLFLSQDIQPEENSLAGGDNRMSSLYATSRARWRGFRLRRRRMLHTPGGDRTTSLLPIQVLWNRNRDGVNSFSLWQQWRHILVGLARGRSVAHGRRTLETRRLEQRSRPLRQPGHAVSSSALTLSRFAERRRRTIPRDRAVHLLAFDDRQRPLQHQARG